MQINHRSQQTAPQNTIALMDALGATRAARAIGVSTTLLYTARSKGSVSKVVEKAAEGALRGSLVRTAKPVATPAPEPQAQPEETALILIEAQKSKVRVIEKMATQLGAVAIIH